MKALSLAFALLVTFTVSAQYNGRIQQSKPKSSSSRGGSDFPLSERLYFGGGGSFGTGTHPYYGFKYTYISVNPIVGYRITRPFSVGSSFTYQLYKFPTQGVSLEQYGIGPFAQYRFGQLFGYGEYQMISVPTYDKTDRRTFKRLPIGVGFTQPVGSRAALNVMALYDVIYNKATSPFASPWVVRVFFTAGGVSF